MPRTLLLIVSLAFAWAIVPNWLLRGSRSAGAGADAVRSDGYGPEW